MNEQVHSELKKIFNVRFSFAASQDNISNALENIKKMLTK